MAVAVDQELDLFGVGGSLREARLRRRIELDQVERDTCIRFANLEAIEEERYDDLPGDVYATAFVREYASYLGLDAERFVQVFKEARAYEPEPIVHEAVTTATRRSRAPLYAVGALAALALALGLYFGLRGGGGGTPAAEPPARTPKQKAAAPPSPAPHPLTLRATGGDSWVVVRFRNAHGKIVWQGTLRQGTMLRFGLRRQLWVGIGKPDAVTARVGSKRVRLDPSLSRFVFGRGRG